MYKRTRLNALDRRTQKKIILMLVVRHLSPEEMQSGHHPWREVWRWPDHLCGCFYYCREAARGQLTMFYGGKVLVFDNFPAEKAKDLMQLATKGNSTSQNSVSSRSVSVSYQTSTLVPNTANNSLVPQVHMSRSAQPNLPGNESVFVVVQSRVWSVLR